MEHWEKTWPSIDHLMIYSQGWEPDDNPSKAVVCLVHGLGEHSERYSHLAGCLTEAGFSVASFDLRGHGKSAGQRGHVSSSEEFLAEIDHCLQDARIQHPGKPCFLYGHSLGGLLVLYFSLKRKSDIAGIIASSPALRSSLQEQAAKVAITRFLSVFFPSMSISTGLKPELLSRDPDVVKRYKEDPLVHDKATLQMAKTMMDMIAYVLEHTAEINVPLLIMHGTADQVVYCRGSEDMAREIKTGCALKLWDGFFHETHNDPGKEQVIEHLIHWLESTI
jgi:acylglycerol lipase